MKISRIKFPKRVPRLPKFFPSATYPSTSAALASSAESPPSRCCCNSHASPTNEKNSGPRPQPFIFNFQPENESFRLRMQFRKSNVSRDELICTLRAILDALEHDEELNVAATRHT